MVSDAKPINDDDKRLLAAVIAAAIVIHERLAALDPAMREMVVRALAAIERSERAVEES